MSNYEEQYEFAEVEQAALPSEQAEYLKTLEAEEAAESIDPEQTKAEEQAEAEAQAMDEQTAGMTAAMGLGTIEFALRRVLHPEFEFTESTKAYAIENLSPVLIKYGAIVPGWLSAYDAEIKAAMAVGKLASEGMETTRKLKAQDAEKAKREAENSDQHQEVAA
ncbi:hypothetical protein [Terasakiella pusilla]|uniref:hypothetical protein n=1 Tax=Terasakiella pusilla TaxID=64973 RepID=UPI003AA85989